MNIRFDVSKALSSDQSSVNVRDVPRLIGYELEQDFNTEPFLLAFET
jgi:hypothetical protein